VGGATDGAGVSFTIRPAPGRIARVIVSPTRPTEADLVSTTGVTVSAELAPGERWTTDTNRLFDGLKRAALCRPNITWPSKRGICALLLEPSAVHVSFSRRILTVRLRNSSAFEMDDNLFVVLPIRPSLLRSNISLLNPTAIRVNISALPGVITASTAFVTLPSIHRGVRPAVVFTLAGDEWSKDVYRHMTVTSVTYTAMMAPSGFEKLRSRLFNPRTNVTWLSPTQIRVDLGPYSGYYPPNNREVLAFRFNRFASRRTRIVLNPVVNLTVVVPRLTVTSGDIVTDRSLRERNVNITILVTNDAFTSDCSLNRITVASTLDTKRDGHTDPRSFVSLASAFIPRSDRVRVTGGGSQMTLALRATPAYRPCASHETVTLTLAPQCFISGLNFGNSVQLRVSIGNSTIGPLAVAFPSATKPGLVPDSNFPGRYRIDESDYREFGAAFNVTITPAGQWTLASAEAVANVTEGSLHCPTCFSARKRALVHGRVLYTVISSTRLTIQFRRDPYYDAPVSGGSELITLDLRRVTTCPSSTTKPLTFVITPRDPAVLGLTLPTKTYAGSFSTVTVNGVDLTRLDALRLVDATSSCATVTAPSNPTRPDTDAVRGIAPSVPRVSNLNTVGFTTRQAFLVASEAAGRFRVCYAVFAPSRGAYMPFVDLSARSGKYLTVVAVVSRAVLPRNASTLVAGVEYRLTIVGRGLRSVGPARDALRLAEVTTLPAGGQYNCTRGTIAVDTTATVGAPLLAAKNITFKFTTSYAGVFAVCFKAANSSTWTQLGQVRASSLVASVQPRYLGPRRAVLRIAGAGIDTRQGRDRWRLVVDLDSWLQPQGRVLSGREAALRKDPCTNVTAVVFATPEYVATAAWSTATYLASSAQPTDVLRRLTQSLRSGRLRPYATSIGSRLGTFETSHMKPWRRGGLAFTTLNVSRDLQPGSYVLCRSTNAWAHPRYQTTKSTEWRAVERIRVFSEVFHYNLSTIPRMLTVAGSNELIATFSVENQLTVHVFGMGFLSGPGKTPEFTLITHDEKDDEAGCRSGTSSIVRSRVIMMTDVAARLQANATIGGRLSVCWTSAERRLAGWSPTPATLQAHGWSTGVSRVVVLPRVRATTLPISPIAGEPFPIQVTGSGLKAATTFVALVPASDTTCPTPAALMMSSSRYGANNSVVQRSTLLTTNSALFSYAASMTACVLVEGVAVYRMPSFAVIARVAPLAQVLFPANTNVNVTLRGIGFNTMPSADRVAIVRTRDFSVPADCGSAAAIATAVLHVSDLGPGNAPATTVASLALPARLPSGNYTICYASFPQPQTYRPSGNFRIATVVDHAWVRSPSVAAADVYDLDAVQARGSAVAGRPFTVVTIGRDLAAFAWTDTSVVFLHFYVDAVNGDMVPCHLTSPASVADPRVVVHRVGLAASYGYLNVTFNASTMGSAAVCIATHDEPATLIDDAGVWQYRMLLPLTVLPAATIVPSSAKFFAGVPAAVNLTGTGIQISDDIMLGFVPVNCPSYDDFPTVLEPALYTTFRAGPQAAGTVAVGLTPITVPSAQTWVPCLRLLGTVAPMKRVHVAAAVAGVTPQYLEPNVANQQLTIIANGLNTVSGSGTGAADVLYLIPAPQQDRIASGCGIAAAAGHGIAITGGGAGSTNATVLLPALSPGNYTVCIAAFPAYTATPIVNVRVLSRVDNFTAARVSVAIGAAVSITLQAVGFTDTALSLPSLHLVHAYQGCDVLSNAPAATEPPSSESESTTVAIPPFASALGVLPPGWPAVPTVERPQAPTQTALILTPPLTLQIPTRLNTSVTLPLMGQYTVCWSTPLRYALMQGGLQGPLANTARIGSVFVVEAALNTSTPTAAKAGESTRIEISGSGLYAPGMNASVVLGPGACNSATMTLSFDTAASTSTLAVLPVTFNVTGLYRVCVGTVSRIVPLGLVNVSAAVNNEIDSLSWEQYEFLRYNITGAGLSLDDEVFISLEQEEPGCAMRSQSAVTYNREATARHGLTLLQLDIDTSIQKWHWVCYRAHLESVFRTVGGIFVTPEVKEFQGLTYDFNPTGDRLTLTFHGHGLNATRGGDAVKVIQGSLDCTTSLATTILLTDDLEPTDAYHQTSLYYDWFNANFPTHQDVNYTVCYRVTRAKDFAYAGYLVLPVANQAPWFNVTRTEIAVLSRPTIVITAVAGLVFGATAGASRIDAGQTLSYSVASNVTWLTGLEVNVTDGSLLIMLPAGASGVVQISITVHDNGGTEHGGQDSFTRTITARISYAENTAPSFTIASPAYARSTLPGVQATTIIADLRLGDHPWESDQTVTYATSVTSIPPYVLTLAVAPNGTALVRLNVSTTERIAKNMLLPFSIVASDDGGTGLSGQEQYQSRSVAAQVEIVVFNNRPTFTWNFPRDAVLVVSQTFTSPQAVAADMSTGGRDVDQHLHFDVAVARADPTDLRPFDCDVTVFLTDGRLKMLCNTLGNYSVRIVLRDDGGAALGGSDESVPAEISLYVVDPFALSISPSSGGWAHLSTFTLSVAGGAPWVNDRGVTMELRLLTEAFDGAKVITAHESIVVRSRGPLQYITDALPEGLLTFYARVWDYTNQTIGTPYAQVTVLKMPSTVSLATIEPRLRAQYPTDIAGASFGAALDKHGVPIDDGHRLPTTLPSAAVGRYAPAGGAQLVRHVERG
jgi:hypothetical protein